MLKVLEITVSAGYGGGPQHVFELVSHIKDRVVVDVACPRQEPYWDRFKQATNGEMIEIPERRFNLGSVLKLVKHIKSREISLLHSHGKGAGVYGRVLSVLTGLPLVHTPHGIHLDHYGRLLQRVYLAYEYFAARFSARIIYVSNSERKRAANLGLWRNVPSIVISNGVRSLSEEIVQVWRKELRRAQGLSDDEVVVISLSRFDYSKNMQEMAEIAANCSRVRFMFVGDGTDRNAIEAWCQTNGIRNAIFPGFVADPLRYLAASDIYLSTSRWEGLPLSILEAMAIGLPVVASDVTGNRDAVSHERTGYLYSLGETLQAVNFLSRLAVDADLRSALGKEGRLMQQKEFSLGSMVDAIFAVYEEVKS